MPSKQETKFWKTMLGKNYNTEKNDNYVNQEMNILRKIRKRASKLASGPNMSSDGILETDETNSVEWLTDKVLRVYQMDFDNDVNIDSDIPEADIE